jgi:hypothetical protein
VTNNEKSDDRANELSWSDLRYWLEFGCWTVLALVPFLHWVNGPAVSDDQLTVRIVLVVLAACGAVGLRSYTWMSSRRSREKAG